MRVIPKVSYLSILLITSEPKECKYSLRSVVTRMIEGALESRAYLTD